MEVKIIKWVIPYYGNKHFIPYGTLLVTDCEHTQVCRTKGDKYSEISSVGQYVTFRRKRFKVTNNGSLYAPQIELTRI